ncbi:MAG: hypothetical protein H6741_07605 [Alphaproteobacteria bacterium]|nr:hypothetical protein [Alphaproteobacteria bacterium]MCB9792581.1 hypothetical protein [Alphaproteobacteria bacterium]
MRRLAPALIAAALTSVALAGQPGHFNPDAVAGNSATFVRYAEALGPKFDEAQQALGKAGAQLEALERGVLLLGERATPELRAHYEGLRKQNTHAYLRTQAHVSLLEEDSLNTFTDAMEKALAQLGEEYDIEECAAASGLAAMTGPGRSGTKSCEGEDLNARIAGIMDEDPELNAAVDEILSIEWPEIAAAPAAQAPVPLRGGGGWVQLAPLAERLIGPRLDAHAAALEAELSPLERGIETGDAEAMAQAQAARDRYEAAIAAEGERLFAALDKRAKKLKLDFDLCANPAGLGGCTGEDLSEAILPQLVADKKLVKALGG